jgi:hypothetical protein
MTSAESIQEQMRQVRCELGEDVQGLVDSARVMADWRHYVRSYPWLCLGLAAAAGFLLVPSRVQVLRPDANTLADLVKRHKVVVEGGPRPTAKPPATMGSMLSGALLQGGLALGRHYLTNYVQTCLARKPERAPHHGEVGEL